MYGVSQLAIIQVEVICVSMYGTVRNVDVRHLWLNWGQAVFLHVLRVLLQVPLAV